MIKMNTALQYADAIISVYTVSNAFNVDEELVLISELPFSNGDCLDQNKFRSLVLEVYDSLCNIYSSDGYDEYYTLTVLFKSQYVNA